ncbi:hypothetical protein [Rhizobium sp. 12,4]|uniref:hypothetical protein n=1 Tax=Rhizobium sp. 12,4 TaxID=3405135 RepID=UPI003D3492B5
MRDSFSAPEIQAPRVLGHSGPFDTPEWIAYAAMAICNNNGIAVVHLKKGWRVPLESAVVLVSDDTPATAIRELREAEPAWTILTRPAKLDDLIPALISTVRNNRHAAIVMTKAERLDSWLAIAGSALVHVAVDDPIGFFGDVIGGVE